MKAPFKKIFLARYVQVLEAIGFVLIGLLIAVMIVSAVYRMDDGVKFRLDTVDPQTDPVELPAKAWVRTVEVRVGQPVDTGGICATVVTNESVVALVEAAAALRRVERVADPPSASPVTPGLVDLTRATREALERTAETSTPVTVRAPVAGIVREAPDRPLDTLAGQVIEGVLMAVENYDVLRLQLPLSGENAARVRINLLAEEDVKDWKELTRLLRGEDPAPSIAVARIRQMVSGELEDIRPGRVPLKRDQPEVVGALNTVLEDAALHDPSAWPSGLPDEALVLIAQGPSQLPRDDLIRLNRLLLEVALGDAVAVSRNELQPVKVTFFVPPSPGERGNGSRPEPYPMQGRVVAEPKDDSVHRRVPVACPGTRRRPPRKGRRQRPRSRLRRRQRHRGPRNPLPIPLPVGRRNGD